MAKKEVGAFLCKTELLGRLQLQMYTLVIKSWQVHTPLEGRGYWEDSKYKKMWLMYDKSVVIHQAMGVFQ